MRMKRRILSLLLCGTMLFSLCSQSVFAEGDTQMDSGVTIGTSNLCEHHTEHDSECGYSDGKLGSSCGHVHTEDCYSEVSECAHEHDENCYPEEAENSISDNDATPSDTEEWEPENCIHTCDGESGCVTEKLDCQHEHDSECGYVSAMEGKPCGYVCEICNAEDSSETASPSNVEIVTVAIVQAMIDDLPNTDKITDENAEEVRVQLEAIDEAKEQLSDVEIDELDFARYIEAAAALEQLLYGTATTSNAVMPLSDYNGPAIVLGATALQGAQKSYVYYGTYKQSSDGQGGYNNEPIKWRVLDADNDYNRDAKEGETDTTRSLFLLSDQNLDVFQYHTKGKDITWKESTMRSWLNGYDGTSENQANEQGTSYQIDNFIGKAFSPAEQNAIVKTTVINKTYDGTEGKAPNPSWDTIPGGDDTDDKIFLLSIAEAKNAGYGFTDNNSGKSENTDYVAGGGEIKSNGMNSSGRADYWWLRSPGKVAKNAACVYSTGNVSFKGNFVTGDRYAVRPAFNLDKANILFITAANNMTGSAIGTMAHVTDYTGNEWKMTLKDDSHNNFSVTAETLITAEINSTVSLNYSGAVTGENEYISVIIEDSSHNLTHYGRIAKVDATDGVVNIPIPSDLEVGTYMLNVFNEQYNGDYKTDYASGFQTVSLNIPDKTAPKLTAGTASRTSDTNAAVTFNSDEAGTYYYAVVDSGAATPSIDTTNTTENGTACIKGENMISLTGLTSASAKDIYIVAKDPAGNVSENLRITIPAYIVPGYTVSTDSTALNSGTAYKGETAPAAQTVISTNVDNHQNSGKLKNNTLQQKLTGGKQPYIQGDSLGNGWENIKNQLETAGEKDTITIAMNGTTVVPGMVFDIIKGKDLTVIFDLGGGISWSVNGRDITADNVKDIDFGVTVGETAGKTIPVEIINNVTGERFFMNLTLSHDGEFGFRAVLTLNVDRKNAGLFANLFYYNAATAVLEYMSAARIDEDGNASLEFVHASDYTIVIDEKDMGAEAEATEEPDAMSGDTGTPQETTPADSNNTALPLAVVLTVAVLLVLTGSVWYALRKKGNKKA